jgi:hypothetical protein
MVKGLGGWEEERRMVNDPKKVKAGLVRKVAALADKHETGKTLAVSSGLSVNFMTIRPQMT